MRFLLVFLLSLTGAMAQAADTQAGQVYDFEGLTALPGDWEAVGPIDLHRRAAYNSSQGLLISQPKEAMGEPCSLLLPAAPAEPGYWTIGLDHKSEIFAPDLSFNLTVSLLALDAAGKQLRRFEGCVISGSHAWKRNDKRVHLPKGTVATRFQLTLHKTHGTIAIDNLSLSYDGPAQETIFSQIRLAPAAYGALFYPGDDVRFDLTVRCSEAWASPSVLVTICDYWGAEQRAPLEIPLTRSGESLDYTGTVDLGTDTWEGGAYYEVRARAVNGDVDVHDEVSAFAILPRPVTKDYRPHEIPFTLNNWDDRMKDTFFMADRIGIRWKLIWAGWESEPPYKPYAPGIEWIEELDMGALLGPRPVGAIEKHRKGYEVWTEESLRQGAYNMVMAYKDRVPLMIRCGNEPHTEPAVVADAMKAYKAVYEGVKAADPDIFFIGTSIGPHEEFFKQGFQNYCDAFDYHTYSGWKRLREITDGYEAMFAAYDVEPKPIYCTEIGLNSQGMSRIDVARDMVKKFAIHFAEGHSNLAWFDLLYPDPQGTIAGSNGEAFNVFNAKYALYSPKITAVMYYNLVNGICIKRFVEERIYEPEIEAILFRDVNDDCLLVLWDELGRGEHFLPLPGVGAVRVQRIDGSERMLDAGGTGLTLTLDRDPLLLHFTAADLSLAPTLAAPQIALVGEPPSIVKGSSTTLTFALDSLTADQVIVEAPPRWQVGPLQTLDGRATCSITAPEKTAASEGRIALRTTSGTALLSIPLPVQGKVDARIVPLPYGSADDGAAGLRLLIRNNGVSDETVAYRVTIPRQIAMEGGTFQKSHATTYAPAFLAEAEGSLVVAGGSEQSVTLPVAGLDAKSLYLAKATVTSASGERIDTERYLAGFVGVPKLDQPLRFDGQADDAAWNQAPVLQIDEAKQYRRYREKEEASRWEGVDDLSATIRFLYDDRYLYLRADITDDAYHHAKADGHLWAMDGLQILVDTNRETDAKSGYYDISMGQGAKGDQAWCHSSGHPTVLAGEAAGVIVRTTVLDDQHRSQVVAIPWAHLVPFEPTAGRNLGLAVIVNEDDGPGRGSFMGWFGCVHSKQLDLVGDLILLP